ncbi:MAG TPA: HPr family phosphocarrier protein [Cellulomonas sp.]
MELIRRYEREAAAAPAGAAAVDAAHDAGDAPSATRTVAVGSRSGLHARPARLFADAAKASGRRVLVARAGGEPVPASSVLAVMSIAAQQGDQVTLTVEGEDAARVADDLAALVARDLDEE